MAAVRHFSARIAAADWLMSLFCCRTYPVLVYSSAYVAVAVLLPTLPMDQCTYLTILTDSKQHMLQHALPICICRSSIQLMSKAADEQQQQQQR
jgi:hypothetical protein